MKRHLLFAGFFLLTLSTRAQAQIELGMGMLAGEATTNSIILQARLTSGTQLVGEEPHRYLPGAPGWGKFAVHALAKDAPLIAESDWIEAKQEQDFIIKARISGLTPGTRYIYKLHFGHNRDNTQESQTGTFKTNAGPNIAAPVSMAVVTGMNWSAFQHGIGNRVPAYDGPDKPLGFPGLESILKQNPDYFVGTGDNVYFDRPGGKLAATTMPQLRAKYHQLFSMPRARDFFSRVTSYWEKDDHDHRYNDSDPYGPKPPSQKLGIRANIEQLPLAAPGEEYVPYRTHRLSKDIQIWLTEGRDFRSPNRMKDGPEKTMWGKEQLNWLKQTLLASDATFRIFISPTPLVGPDAGKTDSHANIGGFQNEGKAFIDWLQENELIGNGFFIICGDRHWQYLSVHPSGLEEFSCGALVDANSRLGIRPGHPRSNDPKGLIKQPHNQIEASGGFLLLDIQPATGDTPPQATFSFYDENGLQLYETKRQ